ncbi:MAG TPA: hypothetical protein DEG17_00925 [Cyanobacteria bacterium UBA11149]|nr:hypothetical protein [Cyanobacteria bacterium UBA11367]HBE59096.1 hypothetical protein [Cyanobacteria bacterium UBA11366]HBK64118.1 hypothetical protein [Cyanobacteria bacterium UBA11166]HBR72776.1 hypothetical protein [Cyanobacteria bacterium UBA11159]HBS67954.1 hypothetical protein [Cyanobacteria bacterium UBA11153]HBW87476.1 hypothetical protein [Cyanobacteria bacterium UBA11149]HCA94062.1 hypothetical protein [Cyanobacteria bacterium UBA9226]
MNEVIQVFLGILIVAVLHLLIFTILGKLVFGGISTANYGFGIIYLFAVLGIGIVQLIYVLPLIAWLKRQQQWGLMRGVMIGAILTALLNAVCYLL